MRLSISTAPVEAASADALAFFLKEDEGSNATVRLLDRRLNGHLARTLEHHAFKGKDGQLVAVDTHGRLPVRQLLVIGIGKKAAPESFRRGAGFAVRPTRGHLAIVAPVPPAGQLSVVTQAVVEGALLGNYRFRKYQKPKEDQREVTAVTLLVAAKARAAADKALVRGERSARATMFARDLVNEPASHLTPRQMVAAAERVAKAPGIRLKIFDEKQLKAMGAEALLGVGRGSDEPPYLVHLAYTPRGAKKTVALVGKGVTFDSGGINLKPEKALDNMKMDMTGAADILAVFSVLPLLKPRVAVHGILPLVENMPSGKALKPGDIVRAMDGTSIEVLNTDAEGRLILADGLTYARKLKPNALIDVATLTGACIVALGEDIAGLFSTHPKLAADLRASADGAGESLWELPLVDSYQKLIESDIADLKNTGKPGVGGAITAALFLKHFAKDIPWAHLDVAGPAWAEDDRVPYLPKGATGFGVRTLLNYLTR